MRNMSRSSRVLSPIILFFCVFLLSVPAGGATCSSLTRLKLPNTVITAAQDVGPGKFLPPEGRPSEIELAAYHDLPAFCRVRGIIQPSADSHIEFEVWLPASGWNGRYMGVGNGGSGGSINYASYVHTLADSLRDGFAASSTDTGHRGADDDFSFARGHREKRIDYHYRAIHDTALAAKAVIGAFYGTAPKYSYFVGGSDGGRQGLMEAQRYPLDYDGVLVFAPTLSRTGSVAAWTWVAQAVAGAGGDIPQNSLSLVQAAAIAACDSLDGVTDGITSEPTKCRFDPASLLCKDGTSERCLTQPQVAALKKFYAGPRNSKGEHIAPGFLPGAETDPAGSLSCKSCKGSGFHRASIFLEGMLDSRFTVDTFDFDRDMPHLESAEDAKLTNATEANLKAFKDRGGKLIIAHGWSDGVDTPLITVNYYDSVVMRMGVNRVSEFLRLYMVPGVYHNIGQGPGLTTFREPMMTALQHWVEKRVTPGSVVATKYKTDGNPSSGVVRTRPLCPYPQVAQYRGTGSIDDAANFACRAP
jgi:Tannase and feruloyl esterase